MVVLIHGGFWRARYGKDLRTPLADDLAARGIAAWNAQYRRPDKDGGWPVTAQDVAASIDFLRDELGHEPLAAVGHPGEVILCDAVTVSLFKLVGAQLVGRSSAVATPQL